MTIFHSYPLLISPIFESYSFFPFPLIQNWESVVTDYNLIIVQNDHSERSWSLLKLREEKQLPNLIFFFPTYCKMQKPQDVLFDPKLSIATNIAEGCRTILKLKKTSKENDLTLPREKVYRRFPKRIVIHPTSRNLRKNWAASKYIKLAKLLQHEGYSISFSVGPEERKEWLYVEKMGLNLPSFGNLREVADYLYESGFLIGNDSAFGHLASNLKIPTLIISGDPKRILQWRPDWLRGQVVTPPFSLPSFKNIFSPNFWPYFISVKRIQKVFYALEKKNGVQVK